MSNTILMRSLLVLFLLSGPMLMACAKPTVAVNIHGVNHSPHAFSYVVIDPSINDSSGVGELIDPFAAGGTVCCFNLPKKWRPGIKVQIKSTHWIPKAADGSFSEVKNNYTVEVQAYPDGKPGELWVLGGVDGTISVVSSDFQPDHAKWPGNPKGWPVASLEYRRERWQLLKEHEQRGVELYESLLERIGKNPERVAREFWDSDKNYRPQSITQFAGPDDPRYMLHLKDEFKTGLDRSRKLLQRVIEARP